ncbi:MAG: DUF3429 domain-containing protein [Alphaproteobacteria bacterium]
MAVFNMLTYLGILPFLICLVGGIYAPMALPWSKIMLGYGAVILSFLSGIQWGLVLKTEDEPADLENKNLIVMMTNVLTLVAWLTLLIPNIWYAFLTQLLLFASTYMIDKALLATFYPAWYMQMRFNVTVSVMVMLVIRLIY